MKTKKWTDYLDKEELRYFSFVMLRIMGDITNDETYRNVALPPLPDALKVDWFFIKDMIRISNEYSPAIKTRKDIESFLGGIINSAYRNIIKHHRQVSKHEDFICEEVYPVVHEYCKNIDVSYAEFEKRRMLRTETVRAINIGFFEGYKLFGYEQFRIISGYDERMCAICGEKHGRVIHKDFILSFLDLPPFHPHCRCMMIGKK